MSRLGRLASKLAMLGSMQGSLVSTLHMHRRDELASWAVKHLYYANKGKQAGSTSGGQRSQQDIVHCARSENIWLTAKRRYSSMQST